MSFTKKDLLDIPNTISIVRQVDETHKGIGVRAALTKVIDCANDPVLLYGIKGSAKTTCVELIETIPHKEIIKSHGSTVAGIDQNTQNKLNNSQVSWLAPDLSTLTNNVRSKMLSIVSNLTIDGYMHMDTGMYNFHVDNCDLSWIGACTFEVLNSIKHDELWTGQYSDRIIRVFCWMFDKRSTNRNKPDPKIFLEQLPNPNDVQVDEDELFQEVVKLFHNQFTDERAYIHALKLISGSAVLNLRNYSTPADKKFLLLNKLDFTAEALVGSRATMSSPLLIAPDLLVLLSESLKHNGISTRQIVERYLVDPRYMSDTVSYTFKHFDIIDVKKVNGDITVFPSKQIMDMVNPVIKFQNICKKYGAKLVKESGIDETKLFEQQDFELDAKRN